MNSPGSFADINFDVQLQLVEYLFDNYITSWVKLFNLTSITKEIMLYILRKHRYIFTVDEMMQATKFINEGYNKGIITNEYDADLNSKLINAADHGYFIMVKLLIGHNINNIYESTIYGVLLTATNNGINRSRWEGKNLNKYTWGRFNGYLNIVKELFKLTNNDIYTSDKYTELIQNAAYNRDTRMIKYLIGIGADMTANNHLLLQLSAYDGRLGLLKYLVNKYNNIFDSYYLNDRYNIAIEEAASKGHLNIIRYFIRLGVDVNAKISKILVYERETEALIKAAEHGHLDIVQYLIDQNVNIHINNDQALQWAAMKGHLDIVKYLVEHGADIHSRGDGALNLATNHRRQDVVDYLKSLY